MAIDGYPEKQVRITGIGQSKVGRPSDRSALQLTLDACLEAIADAGLSVDDIDGLTCHFGKIAEGGGISPVGTIDTMLALGIRPVWTNPSSVEGPGHMGAIFQAVMAVATGLCRHVLVFRTVAQATSRLALRTSTLLTGSRGRVDGGNAFLVPYHAHSPANLWALYAQAYFAKYGVGPEQLGWVAVNGRRMAAHNPNAIYQAPITLDDYLAARMISSPLRLFDCDSHIDGSTALIISHKDAAKDLRNPPIEAMGMSVGGIGEALHEGDFTAIPATRAGKMLWRRTDLSPKDVDCAQIYDGFSIHVWLWLEAVGYAPPARRRGSSRVAAVWRSMASFRSTRAGANCRPGASTAMGTHMRPASSSGAAGAAARFETLGRAWLPTAAMATAPCSYGAIKVASEWAWT